MPCHLNWLPLPPPPAAILSPAPAPPHPCAVTPARSPAAEFETFEEDMVVDEERPSDDDFRPDSEGAAAGRWGWGCGWGHGLAGAGLRDPRAEVGKWQLP